MTDDDELLGKLAGLHDATGEPIVEKAADRIRALIAEKAEAEVERLRGLLREARRYVNETYFVDEASVALVARIDAELATEGRT